MLMRFRAMTTYSIYLPPERPGTDPEREFRLLPDGGSLFALILPLVWLIWNRLWIALLAYLLIVAALGLASPFLNPVTVVILSGLPALYLFLEGRELICRKYERAGWHYRGTVEADALESAEMKVLSRDGLVFDPVSVSRHSAALDTKMPPRPVTVQTGIFPE